MRRVELIRKPKFAKDRYMAMDPHEKDLFRQKMADRMLHYLEGSHLVSCVSAHVYDQPRICELCLQPHSNELLVIKTRSNKKMMTALDCLKEMVRFHVTDVEDLPKWLEKMKELRQEEARRKEELGKIREEERRRLEKRIIVRKRPQPGV